MKCDKPCFSFISDKPYGKIIVILYTSSIILVTLNDSSKFEVGEFNFYK